MKTFTKVLVGTTGFSVLVLLVYLFPLWTASCVTTPSPPAERIPKNLDSWSAFLGEPNQPLPYEETARILLWANGQFYRGHIDFYTDPILLGILQEHPFPGENAFVRDINFQFFTSHFADASEFRKFGRALVGHLHIIKVALPELGTDPLIWEVVFPSFYRWLGDFDLTFSERQPSHLSDKVYSKNDEVYFQAIRGFANAFRGATNHSRDLTVAGYRTHFLTSRNNDPADILRHIQTLDDLEASRFRDPAQRGLIRLLEFIRSEFPELKDDEG